MMREITEEEIKRANRQYFIMANPIINRISEIHRFLMPKVIVTKLGTKSFYEKNEEVEFLEKKIEELKKQIILDLENGKFR